MGRHIWRLSFGRDERVVHTNEGAKSVSAETTFNEDLRDPEALSARLWSLCEKVAHRAKADQVSGRVLTLKLKTSDFKIRTRRRSLDQPTQMAHMLYTQGRDLLLLETDGTPFRLLGIGISGLSEDAEGDRRTLFNADEHRQSEAERTMDRIRGKFGRSAIKLGRGIKGKRED
jgi:DNA polymerase-4